LLGTLSLSNAHIEVLVVGPPRRVDSRSGHGPTARRDPTSIKDVGPETDTPAGGDFDTKSKRHMIQRIMVSGLATVGQRQFGLGFDSLKTSPLTHRSRKKPHETHQYHRQWKRRHEHAFFIAETRRPMSAGGHQGRHRRRQGVDLMEAGPCAGTPRRSAAPSNR